MAREYVQKHLQQALKSLESVVEIYGASVDFDVSSRVGLSMSMKEEAKQLVEQGGLKKAVYDKLLRLDLDEGKVKESDEGSD